VLLRSSGDDWTEYFDCKSKQARGVIFYCFLARNKSCASGAALAVFTREVFTAWHIAGFASQKVLEEGLGLSTIS
jgi:hypothetical protein